MTISKTPTEVEASIRTDLWADDIRGIVDAVMIATDENDMSTEQCIALGIILERRRANNLIDLLRRQLAERDAALELVVDLGNYPSIANSPMLTIVVDRARSALGEPQ